MVQSADGHLRSLPSDLVSVRAYCPNPLPLPTNNVYYQVTALTYYVLSPSYVMKKMETILGLVYKDV